MVPSALRPAARVMPTASLLAALAACAAAPDVAPAAGGHIEHRAAPPSQGQASPQDPRPPFVPPQDGADWIRLKSGEWLRGEFTVLRDGTVEFDSTELEELELDWDDIVEIHVPAARAVLLDDGTIVDGSVVLRDGEATVDVSAWMAGAPTRQIPRRQILAIVRRAEREIDRWTGKLSLGATQRSGNTSQTDGSAWLFLRRETAWTRWETNYNGAVSEVSGVETANNHRLRSRDDWFLARHLFVTPLGIGLYRDTFQNIAFRATPFAGVGYDVIDRAKVSWSISTGPAYQYTRYDTVAPGDSTTDGTWAGVLQSRFEWDITPDVEFDFDYDLTVPLPESSAYSHHLALVLSVDFIGDFDVDLSFVWDRVNEPTSDDQGAVPLQDDYRTSVGIGYSF